MSFWKKIEDFGHKYLGIDKDHLSSVTPIISAVNPVAGIIYGGVTGGKEGIKNGIVSAVLGNIASGKGLKNLLDFSAKHNMPGLTDMIKNTFKDTNKLAINVLTSGGDVKKALLTTLMQQNPSLSKYGGQLSGLLGNIAGINLKDFGLNDIAGIYSIVKYITDKGPEPPTPAALEMMGPDKVDAMYKSYSDILDKQTQKNLATVRDQYNQRGLLRSGFELNQERKVGENAATQLANYKANLDTQALQYNNQLKTQQYNNALQRYAIDANLNAQQKQALADMATQYVNKNGGDLMTALTNILGGKTSSTPATPTTPSTPSIDTNNDWITNMQNDINGTIPTIPDINLQDQINQNQNNYTSNAPARLPANTSQQSGATPQNANALANTVSGIINNTGTDNNYVSMTKPQYLDWFNKQRMQNNTTTSNDIASQYANVKQNTPVAYNNPTDKYDDILKRYRKA